MEIRSRDRARPFVTNDGSLIRSLLDLSTAPVQKQSLAEATLSAGQSTRRHYHVESEEIYYIIEGTGEMEVNGERSRVVRGDAILIPPGAWHQLRASATGPVRLLCACSPPWRAEDTFFQ